MVHRRGQPAARRHQPKRAPPQLLRARVLGNTRAETSGVRSRGAFLKTRLDARAAADGDQRVRAREIDADDRAAVGDADGERGGRRVVRRGPRGAVRHHLPRFSSIS